MQNLLKIIENERQQRPALPSGDILNICREYVQTLILKSVYQSKAGKMLSFMGGTCLRMCYGLKRYSEDLDLALDMPGKGYSFFRLNQTVKKDLEFRGFQLGLSVGEDKIVQKSFIRVENLLDALGIAQVKSQKLHIKVEVDTSPIDKAHAVHETFFIARFNEMFPVLKHDLETLYAGKVLAILCRPYARGRDYYDLIWYMARKTKINLSYLNEGIRLAAQKSKSAAYSPFSIQGDVYALLRERVAKLKTDLVMKDMGHLLEDPQETAWIKRYKEVFQQYLPVDAS